MRPSSHWFLPPDQLGSSFQAQLREDIRYVEFDSPLRYGKDAGTLLVSQDFHYGFLASIDYTSDRLGRNRGFHHFHIFILRESGAAREVASLASSGYEKAGSA
jgi:hypothetical protein